MTRWFHARHRLTGEEQWPAAADNQIWPGGLAPSDWILTPIPRERGEFDIFVDGALTLDAAACDAALHWAIDDGASAIRGRFMTTSPGQAMVYMRKEVEARAYLEDSKAGSFPIIAAEAGATEQSPADLAGEIIRQADRCAAAIAVVEAARHAAKRAVSAAEDEKSKRAAAVVDWGAVYAGAAQAAAL